MNRSSLAFLLLLQLPFVANAQGIASAGSSIVLASPPAPPHNLGTLFYTPTERVALVLGRTGETLSESRTDIAINGLVKRPEQRGAVWINGRQLAEGTAVPPAPPPVITKSGVVVAGKPVRVGETIDLDSGKRTDLLPDGAISIRKGK